MVMLKGGGGEGGEGWVMDHRELFQRRTEEKPFVRLLEGSQIHLPQKPRRERNPEHEARMEGLRRRMEQQEYAAMTGQPQATPDAPLMKDEMRQIRQQMTLVVNVLVSVFATAFVTWFFSAAWSPEVRILLCLITALVVLVAEVGLYTIYVYRS